MYLIIFVSLFVNKVFTVLCVRICRTMLWKKNDYSIFNEITLHVGVDRKSYYIYVPKFRGLYFLFVYLPAITQTLLHTCVSQAKKKAYYGPGTGTIFLANIQCSGLAMSLSTCWSLDPWMTAHCNHSEDAGVQCRISECCLPPLHWD